MKTYIIILFLLFFGCSKNKLVFNEFSKGDSLDIDLDNAENIELPYYTREESNQKALCILLRKKNDSLNREGLLKVSWNFFHIKEWENLKKTSIIVFKRSLEKQDTLHMADSYRCMGSYHESISQNDSAFYYYLKAKNLYKTLKDNKRLCLSFQDIAIVQYYSNDYLGSELSLINALKISKRYKLYKDKYFIFKLIGVNSYGLKNYEKAIEYHSKALKILRENKILCNNNEITNCLSNIGNSYLNSGKIKESVLFFEEGLKEYNHKKNTPDVYTYSLDNFANSKILLNDYKGVKDSLIKSSYIRDRLNINQGKNYNKLFLSEYYAAIKDTLNAKLYAQEAYRLSKAFRAPNDILLSLKQLTKVDPTNALKYSSQYIKISDSMQQLERETRNKFAKIAYETQEITDEKDTAIHQKYIFLGIAILVFIVGLLLFIVISQRIKQKELQFTQEQQKNNQEIFQLIQSQQTKINEGRHIEKQRIARELHDGIMNKLASTRLNLHILDEKSTKETIKKCLPYIDEIQKIEKEIRNIAHDLNKDAFSNNDSFIATIESLFEEQKQISKIKCHLEIDPEINWDKVESSKKIDIYRIFQETLSNTNKHSNAQNIVASILKRENALLMEIYDDGIGFSLNRKKKGIGLQNIYSRTKAFNGSIEIKSKKDEGTAVIITIPIKSNT